MYTVVVFVQCTYMHSCTRIKNVTFTKKMNRYGNK